MVFEIALMEISKFARVGSEGLTPLSPSDTWMFCLFAVIASHLFIVDGHQSVSSGVNMGGSSQSCHFHCSSVRYPCSKGLRMSSFFPTAEPFTANAVGIVRHAHTDHFASTAHPKAGV